MKVTLHFQVKGQTLVEEYDSPTDAIYAGVDKLFRQVGVPKCVISFNGEVIANQDDLFIAWESEAKSRGF